MEAELKEALGKRYPAGLVVDVLVLDREARMVRIKRRGARQSFWIELKWVRLIDGRWHKGSGKGKKK